MRILNIENNNALKDIQIFLTPSEAEEMLGDLQRLIKEKKDFNHAHIADQHYKHEITISIYDNNNISTFNERARILINKDV